MLWLPLLAVLATVQGRAVNISNTWVLPEEGFPVFYRYFRDRISWYEADAVCQFHHANLVTVDTTAQYDAVRAYLKELDISSAVWVGLIRSNPDGDFTWTDYRGLSNDGYWSSAPDARAAPLCAAADPAADYRWEARACGGPTVASFICELPVPQWALGNDGCMVRALPALTVLYLPESAAVQLTADCGMAGVKKVQCTGNVKRDELLKDLSCTDQEDLSTSSLTFTNTQWPMTTDTSFTDQESTSDPTTEDNTATEHEVNQSTTSTATPIPYILNNITDNAIPTKHSLSDNKDPLEKIINLDHNNNIQSNDIPSSENKDREQDIIKKQKMEEHKNLQHKLLHEELTRLGNLETIFTQPTDHFIPPLVMAKARINNDMTVLSLEEKHAQQIAEQHFNKNIDSNKEQHDKQSYQTTIEPTLKSEHDHKLRQEQTLVMAIKSGENYNLKKEIKSSVPKKYNEKYENPKSKTWKTIDTKIVKTYKKVDVSTPINKLNQDTDTTTPKTITDSLQEIDDDPSIDLTVIIKEPGKENEQKVFYSNHSINKSKVDITTQVLNNSNATPTSTEVPITKTTVEPPTTGINTSPSIIMKHEIIKITAINENPSSANPKPIIFEISTMVPTLENNDSKSTSPSSNLQTHTVPTSPSPSVTYENLSTGTPSPVHDTTPIEEKQVMSKSYSTEYENFGTNVLQTTKNTHSSQVVTTVSPSVYVSSDATIENKMNNYDTNRTESITAENMTQSSTTEKQEVFNQTETFDEEHEQHESVEGEVIDDFQSPLLSAANEPLHRPTRSRRPLSPLNRINKFNPFRILG